MQSQYGERDRLDLQTGDSSLEKTEAIVSVPSEPTALLRSEPNGPENVSQDVTEKELASSVSDTNPAGSRRTENAGRAQERRNDSAEARERKKRKEERRRQKESRRKNRRR